MAGEATLRVSLQIVKGNVQYQSPQTGFQDDVAGSKGPCVGAVAVPPAGLDIDLSELTIPGWCYVQNQDPTNFVQLGIREPATNRFFPLLLFKPGQGYPVNLSPYVGEQYDNTGTGTSASINKLHAKADRAPCNVLFQIFEA